MVRQQRFSGGSDYALRASLAASHNHARQSPIEQESQAVVLRCRRATWFWATCSAGSPPPRCLSMRRLPVASVALPAVVVSNLCKGSRPESKGLTGPPHLPRVCWPSSESRHKACHEPLSRVEIVGGSLCCCLTVRMIVPTALIGTDLHDLPSSPRNPRFPP